MGGDSKKELRRVVLTAMKNLSLVEKTALDTTLSTVFLKSAVYQQAQVIATYLSLPHELDTHTIIMQAQKDNKRVLVPKVLTDRQMVFVDYDEMRLAQSSLGVWEPVGGQVVDKTEIDLIHVPGVVFTKDGYRIGYGGGYYDRYLADFKGQTISTVYPCQLGCFAKESHDVAVEEVLTYETIV